MTIEDIARVCHEANRAYCRMLGDWSQMPWSMAPEWQKESAIAGVRGIDVGSVMSPEDSHKEWMELKRMDGWVYGPEKDAEKKTHPCMVPYEELPEEQRKKDALFMAVALALLS